MTTKKGLSSNDPSSYSHPDDCRITHLDLDLNVDFNTHIFSGFAHLTVEKQRDGVDIVVCIYICTCSSCLYRKLSCTVVAYKYNLITVLVHCSCLYRKLSCTVVAYIQIYPVSEGYL